VEGLDAKLLMSLRDENIPDFIIFEDDNLDAGDLKGISDFFIHRGFKLNSDSGICMATR
jgi:hypothetical protein